MVWTYETISNSALICQTSLLELSIKDDPNLAFMAEKRLGEK
jgi:hypothetical protein